MSMWKKIGKYLEVDARLDTQSDQKYVQPPPFYCGPKRGPRSSLGKQYLAFGKSEDLFSVFIIIVAIIVIVLFMLNVFPIGEQEKLVESVKALLKK